MEIMKVTNADDHCCWLCCILSVKLCDLFLKLQRRDGDEAGVFTKVLPDSQCQIPANNILLFCCLILGLSFCYNQKHRYFISTLCFWVHQIEDPSNYSDRHWSPLWAAGVKQRRGDHRRRTPAPAPWRPSPRSSGSPSSPSLWSTSVMPCAPPCRSIFILGQKCTVKIWSECSQFSLWDWDLLIRTIMWDVECDLLTSSCN